MTTKFPITLACLTLSHVIDDIDAVEGYLSEDPSAPQCMPIILRDLFFSNPKNTGWQIPMSSSIPSGATTLRYLSVLWSSNTVYQQIIDAGRLGALYLIPYLFPQILLNDPDVYNYNGGFQPIRSITMERWKFRLLKDTLTSALIQAAANGYTDVVRLLHNLGADVRREQGTKYQEGAMLAAEGGHIDTVLYLLSRPESTSASIAAALIRAIYDNNFPLFKAIYDQNRTSVFEVLNYFTMASASRKTADKWIKQINTETRTHA